MRTMSTDSRRSIRALLVGAIAVCVFALPGAGQDSGP